MNLTCPHCGYSRELAAQALPPRTLRVTCPRCQEHFVFQRGQEPLADAPLPEREPPEPAPLPAAERAADPPAPPPRYAGFWLRLGAALLDQLLLGLGLLAGQGLLMGAALLAGASLDSTVHGPVGWLVNLFGMLLALVYFVTFTAAGGQTPGKMALRLRVLRTDGAPVGFARAFLREGPGKLLSTLLLLSGYLLVVFDPRKQGLHDKLAGTCVIRL